MITKREKCTCCGRRIQSWRALAFVGFQSDGEGNYLELRNCGSCYSTMGVAVTAAYVAARRAGAPIAEFADAE
jgi:hypothetical protein